MKSQAKRSVPAEIDKMTGEAIRAKTVTRVSLTQVRDAAWQVPEPTPSIEGTVEPELLRSILGRNKSVVDAEQRERLLDLLCRPINQRGRMQKHWNGDPADIEATRILFGPILAGEIMTAI